MKQDTTYRFNLQFRALNEDQFRIGELLEKLGRKKSLFVVDALSYYIANNPELVDADIEQVVQEQYATHRLHLEKAVRSLVDMTAGSAPKDLTTTAPTEPVPSDEDISQMLDHLDMFG